MENGSPKQLRSCRRLAAVAAALYALSLPLPAIRLGVSPETWTGFECLLALATTFPVGFILHLSPWANLTFAAGWFVLRRGGASWAAALGAASVALAASFYIVSLTEPGWPDGRWPVLAGYWTWIASMVVLVVAPLLTRGDSVTADPIP
jgi:hypothetical protein